MTTQVSVLIDSKEAATSTAAADYTSPSSTRSQLDKLTLTNNSGSARTADVYLVPPGGSPGATNKVVSAKAVANGADETITTVAAHALMPGGSIFVVASGAGVVVRLTGRTHA